MPARCRARRRPRAARPTPRATAGSGAPSGITSAISDARGGPRSARRSCMSRAVSLGAGGHLNGVEVTPTIDPCRPRTRRARHAARTRRPPCRTRGPPRPGRAWPTGGGRRRARPPSGRPRTCRRRSRPASPPGRSTGSSAWTKRTPGLTRSAYGWATCVGQRSSEHHVELREAEDEALALVDQRRPRRRRPTSPTASWSAPARRTLRPAPGCASPNRTSSVTFSVRRRSWSL